MLAHHAVVGEAAEMKATTVMEQPPRVDTWYQTALANRSRKQTTKLPDAAIGRCQGNILPRMSAKLKLQMTNSPGFHLKNGYHLSQYGNPFVLDRDSQKLDLPNYELSKLWAARWYLSLIDQSLIIYFL
jgi:hypothetical protein